MEQSPIIQKHHKHILFTISMFCLIGLAIIINYITVSSQSIRLDESQSLWAATKSIPALLTWTSQDVHVPLYNLMLHFWIQIFGTNIAVVRRLSFMFFLLTLPVLYKAFRQVSNYRVSLLAVTIFALSPFILWYSDEARMYTLFAFATGLNHLYFIKFYNSNGEKWKFGYFLSTMLGLFSHYFFFFLLVTQFIYMLGIIYFTKPRQLPLLQKIQIRKGLIIRYVQIMLLCAVLFLPWVMFVLSSGAAANTQPLIPAPTTYNIFQAFINFLLGFPSTQVQTLVISLWPLIVLLFFFIFTRRRSMHIKNSGYFLLTAFLPIVIVFAISFIRPIFLSRYLIFVTPSLFFVCAWMLLSYSKRISSVLVTAFLVMMVSLLLYQNISNSTPVKEDYVGVSDYLDQNATESDVIAISAPFTIYPIAYSYTGQAGIVTIPQWDLYNSGPIPPFSLSSFQQNLATYTTEYNRIYVVLSYDQGYESKIKNYMDTHYKRVIQKTFSPGLEVDAYQLRYDAVLTEK
ncbi:MAG TPA: glycosyltransferase family 39 protein [Patescibacteria group bacterium]|nr:glycosyltransferase family 39 protein [Patescibacteria group bacterium]